MRRELVSSLVVRYRMSPGLPLAPPSDPCASLAGGHTTSFVVKELFDGGPAAECGRINCGDRIVSVDGKRVTGLSLSAVSHLICGLPSTTVSIEAVPAASAHDGCEAEAYVVDLVRVSGSRSSRQRDTEEQETMQQSGDAPKQFANGPLQSGPGWGSDLQQQLGEAESKVQALESRLKRALSDLVEKETDIAALKEQLGLAKENCRTHEQEHQKMIKSLEDMLANSQAIKEHRDALQDMWREAKDKFEEEEQHKLRVQRELSQIQHFMISLRHDHRSQVNMLLGTVERAVEEVHEAQEMATRTSLSIHTMRQAFDQQQVSMSVMKQENTEREKQMSDLESHTQALLERTLQQHQESFAQATEETEHVKAQLSTLQAKYDVSKETVAALEMKVNGQNQHCESEINALQETLRQAWSDLKESEELRRAAERALYQSAEETKVLKESITLAEKQTEALLERTLQQHQESFAQATEETEHVKAQLSTLQAKYNTLEDAGAVSADRNRELSQKLSEAQKELLATQDNLVNQLKDAAEGHAAERARAIQDLESKHAETIVQLRRQCDEALHDVQRDCRSQLDGMRDLIDALRDSSKHEREKETRMLQHHFHLERCSLQVENDEIKAKAVRKEQKRADELQRALERCQSDLADEGLKLMQKKKSCSALEAMVARRDEEIELLKRQRADREARCACRALQTERCDLADSAVAELTSTCASLEDRVRELTQEKSEPRAALNRADKSLREQWEDQEKGETGEIYNLI